MEETLTSYLRGEIEYNRREQANLYNNPDERDQYCAIAEKLEEVLERVKEMRTKIINHSEASAKLSKEFRVYTKNVTENAPYFEGVASGLKSSLNYIGEE